jgi:DNA-binding IscR family transcriptional regulator
MVQIAKEVGTTYHYVHKITKKLNKKKWIASRSGPHGGIVCVPRFLTLRDVIELWESPYSLARQSNKVKGAAIVYEEWLIAAEQVRVRTFGG